MKGRETGVNEVTKRNGLPQAKLAEIDDAIMGISEALREARTLTRSTDPVVLAATVKLGIRHGRRGTYAAAREADRYDLISNVQHLADNPVRIRFSGSGYQAADRQALVLYIRQAGLPGIT